MDSIAAFECNGLGIGFWQAGYFDIRSVHWERCLVCKHKRECKLRAKILSNHVFNTS